MAANSSTQVKMSSPKSNSVSKMLCTIAYCCRRTLVMRTLGLFLLALLLHAAASQEEASDDRYITCDFDLENIEHIIEYLPQLCQDVYNNRTQQPALYQDYLQEAEAFERFIRKLLAHEWPAGSEQPTFDAELRYAIYNETTNCWDANAFNTTEEYLLCKQENYVQLTNALTSDGGGAGAGAGAGAQTGTDTGAAVKQ